MSQNIPIWEILFRLWTDQLCIPYVLSYLTQCSIMYINVCNSGSQDSDKTIIPHTTFTRCLFIIRDYAFFIKTHFISLTVLTCILNMLAIADAEFSGNKSEHFPCLKVTSDSSIIINWPWVFKSCYVKMSFSNWHICIRDFMLGVQSLLLTMGVYSFLKI